MARWHVVDSLTSVPVPLDRIGELGILPVVIIDRVDDAEPIAAALADGGLPCAEVTFRTPAAAGAIERMMSAFPEMVIGAGTVLSVAQAESAVAAGAQFVVGPGFDRAVVEWCQRRGVPVVPGAMTPTEVSAVLGLGISLVKFFPAESAGGVRTLEAFAGPFPDALFLPTGGIDESNLSSYLRLPMVSACGSSWPVDRDLVRDGDFAAITERSATAAATVREARSAR